jgi:hypothetical protein
VCSFRVGFHGDSLIDQTVMPSLRHAILDLWKFTVRIDLTEGHVMIFTH